jgi:hypothetical protein
MKMLATLAIAMMVSTASASAVPGFTFRYECKVTETTDSSDKDPVSKANIAIALTMVDDNHARPAFFVDATHTTASGATYNVKDRYADYQTGKVIEWGMAYWQGKDKKNHVTVFAGFETNDKEYVYKVVFSKDVGNGKFEKIKEINSTCDMATF